MDSADQQHMERALELAARGQGRTHPNPMVGCVIVRDGEVLAEGYHHKAGDPHGEIEALNALGGDAQGSTLYVNLEPCSHYGRTPPCTDAIVAAGVARVVIGTGDPNPKVDGSGIQKLRDAGIQVETGVCLDAAERLNAAFFNVIRLGRPLIAAKFAMTLDGKIATHTGASAWISNEKSREYVHELRNAYDAIMVGSGTLAADNPRLTCRIDGGRNPVRVMVDSKGATDASANVYVDDGTHRVTFVSEMADSHRIAELRAAGVDVQVVPSKSGHVDVEQALQYLAGQGLNSVLVEGGSGLLGVLFDHNLIDRVHAFVAPKLVGGADAPSPIGGQGLALMTQARDLVSVAVRQFDGDVLIEGELQPCSLD